MNKRLVIFLLMFPASLTTPAAEVRVTITKVDDGDSKTQQLEHGGAWNYGIKQDDAYALLRSSMIRSGARGKRRMPPSSSTAARSIRQCPDTARR